jgi:hypothetical protein
MGTVKFLFLAAAVLAALIAPPSAAVARCSGHYWGGGGHTRSHGGTYIGGVGSSHKVVTTLALMEGTAATDKSALTEAAMRRPRETAQSRCCFQPNSDAG